MKKSKDLDFDMKIDGNTIEFDLPGEMLPEQFLGAFLGQSMIDLEKRKIARQKAQARAKKRKSLAKRKTANA